MTSSTGGKLTSSTEYTGKYPRTKAGYRQMKEVYGNSLHKEIKHGNEGKDRREKKMKEKMEIYIEPLSCVFRAGRKGAETDHTSIFFHVDIQTAKCKKGTVNSHWYDTFNKKLSFSPSSGTSSSSTSPSLSFKDKYKQFISSQSLYVQYLFRYFLLEPLWTCPWMSSYSTNIHPDREAEYFQEKEKKENNNINSRI